MVYFSQAKLLCLCPDWKCKFRKCQWTNRKTSFASLQISEWYFELKNYNCQIHFAIAKSTNIKNTSGLKTFKKKDLFSL